jgi:ubiquitin C-terminal hydrolase
VCGAGACAQYICISRYLCSNCNALQDATRRVELRQLPPILHISLLRFVFDLTSLERKKSKLALSFPETINMSQFTSDPAQSTGQDIYQLRGVLLHKGASAYHGHYEAEAFDEQWVSFLSERVQAHCIGFRAAKWYTFNDQTVTELNPSNSQAKKVKERPTVASVPPRIQLAI